MENYESENQELTPTPTPEETAEETLVESAEDPVVDTAEEPVAEIIEEPVEEIPEEPVRRSASPFADSPYVMPHQPYAYEVKPVKKQPKKAKGKVWKSIVAAILTIALVAAGCCATAYGMNLYWQGQASAMAEKFQAQIEDLQEQIEDNSYTGNGNSISGTPNVSADGMTPGQVYAKCVDSVVAIVTNTASGSGFLISTDGYILTNYHVVEGSRTISVTLHDGTLYEATGIGYDDTNDIALLKIEGTDFPAATMGKSDNLIVGDQVVAIGNPLGELTSTLTVGYISAKERDITTDGTIINMLQTDAAINSGNSGGPLFNMKGEVIGITTAKYSGSTTSGASIEGLGFAIPIDDVSDKVQQIINQGYVSTPYMGVSVSNRVSGYGAYVESVEKDGAAYEAGVRAGDLIVMIGDQDVTSLETLTKALRQFKVGDSTTITVLRGRQFLDLSITFREKPNTMN